MIKFWLHGYEDVTTCYIDDSFNKALAKFISDYSIPEALFCDICYEYLM